MLITIIADSKRHDILAEKLKADGHSVSVYKYFEKLPEKIIGDLVILPIPSFKNDGSFNLEGSPESFKPNDLIKKISETALIVTCNYSIENRRYIDINQYEPFVSMNAVPSAEGAISLAMQNCDITLFKSKALVIGYGRIGKIIAERLKDFGSSVTVTARKEKSRFEAEASRLSAIDFHQLDRYLSEFDLVFQTVPFEVLTKERLDKCRGLIIDLSSKCLGTDMKYAQAKGLNFIYAPGIPEKYSSKSAADILYDSIKSIISVNNTETFALK